MTNVSLSVCVFVCVCVCVCVWLCMDGMSETSLTTFLFE